MKTYARRAWVVIACTLIIATRSAVANGLDYRNGKRITGFYWPPGLTNLVNITNRVLGYNCNQEDIFFFAGTASSLTAFLRAYTNIPGIVTKEFPGVAGWRLILHDGKGEAKSMWGGVGRPCDWKLYACPKFWLEPPRLPGQTDTDYIEVLRKNAKAPGFVLEVHFWTGGQIALDEVDVPKNIEVIKER